MATPNQYVSVRETAQILDITEKKVMELIEERKLQAYRIADKFLRLRKTEVQNLRNSGRVEQENIRFEYTPAQRAFDYLRYNDFYFVSLGIICFLLYVIFFD